MPYTQQSAICNRLLMAPMPFAAPTSASVMPRQRPGHDRLHTPGDPPPADQPGLRTRPRGRLALVPLAPTTAVPGPGMPLPAPRLRTHLSGQRVTSWAVVGAAGLVPGAVW